MPGNYRQHIQCGEPVLDRPRVRQDACCMHAFAGLFIFCSPLHVCMCSATLSPPFPPVPTFLLVSCYIPSLPFSPITFSFSIPTSLPPCSSFPIHHLPLEPAEGPISAHSYAQLPTPTTAGTLTFSSSCYGVHQVGGLIHVSSRDQQHWHRKTTLWRSSLSIFLQPSRLVHVVSFVLVFSVND